MKKFIVLLCILLSISVSAQALPIYQYETVGYMANGVTVTNYRQFYSTKTVSVTVVKADISSENISLDLLTAPSVNQLQTVYSHAESQQNVIAAVNGDFFAARTTGYSIGLEVKNGKLLKNKYAAENGMAAVFSDGNSAIMDYMEMHLMVVAPNGNYTEIKYLNNYVGGFEDINMFTSEWNGGVSPAPQGEFVEVVVVDDHITEFRRNLESITIPENGYIFVVSEAHNMFLDDNFDVGDEVKIDLYCTPDLDGIKTAFGGGTLLLKNGEKTPITHNVSGTNPRTALGTSADGKTVYLVTVDGRQTNSAGVTLAELADIMREIGASDAINLDGGGSTRMVGKTLEDQSLHNLNSPTENRKVINAVAITDDSKLESTSGAILSAEKEFVFSGDSVNLKAVTHDKFFHPTGEAVEWSVSGVDGYVNADGVFYPKSAGRAVLTASNEFFSDSIELDVIEYPERISMARNFHCSTGKTAKVEIFGYDALGRESRIDDLSLLMMFVTDPIAEIDQNGVIRAIAAGQTSLAAYFGDASAYSVLTVGSVAASDFLDGFENANAKFTSYPDYVEGRYEISGEEAFEGAKSGKLTFDFSAETEDTKAAYVTFGKPIAIGDNQDKIEIQINAPAGYGHMIRYELTDANGSVVRLDVTKSIDFTGWKRFETIIPDSVARPCKLTKIYVVETDPEMLNSGYIYFDALKITSDVIAEPLILPQNTWNEPLYGSIPDAELTFSAASMPDNAKTFAEALFCREMSSKLKTADVFALASSASKRKVNGNYKMFVCDDCYADEIGSSLFITLNASLGGIRATKAAQWVTMYNTVRDSSAKNLFVILNNDPAEWANAFERDVFFDYLAGVDKNVFVIYNAQENDRYQKDGVHYFALADISAHDGASLATRAQNLEYLTFTVSGGDVRYESNKLFEKGE